MTSDRRRFPTLIVTLLAASIAPTGCAVFSDASVEAATSRGGDQARGKGLSPADFVDTAAPPQTADAPRPAPAVRTITSDEARQGLDDVLTISGQPASPATATRPSTAAGPRETGPALAASTVPADRVVVDELVGQVNGKPVYAAQFFEPLDARLRAEADRLEPAPWVLQTADLIELELYETILDDLLLAEFYGRLTVEQRQGVVFFLQQLRDDIIAGNLGSSERADRRLRETEGLSLEEAVRQQGEQQFIRDVLRREVGRTVNVSWRDIERYYTQNIDEFVTEGEAVLRFIRVPASRAEDAPRVEAALAAGEPFADVASQYSAFARSRGGELRHDLAGQPYGSRQIVGIDELNSLAAGLEEAQAAGPIDIDGSLWWAYLESLTPRQERSLYDAQNDIHAVIYATRFRQREREYIDRLFDAAGQNRVEDMRDRLLSFAVQRYLPADAVIDPDAAGAFADQERERLRNAARERQNQR